jgi:hypothetical protein
MEYHLWNTQPVVSYARRLMRGSLVWRILVSIGLIALALFIPR